MDRNREARRATGIVGSNGFNNRRKHRTNSLRDSPDEDGGVELQQESIKLRERVKKDRDREMNRDRERENRGRDLRERGAERDLRERRSISNNKRRRAERLMASRDEIATSDESENDDLDEEYEDTTATTTAAAGVRFPSAAGSNSHHHHHHHHQSHLSNHHHHHSEQQHNVTSNSTNSSNHHNSLQHRKSFPPISSSSSSSKQLYRPAAPVWKPGDEMIGVSVPRKARSASTKRMHDWASNSSNNSGGGVAGGEQILRQASNSPVRQGGVVSTTPPAPPMSPSSSNASTKKKLKPSSGNVNNGPKLKPPKVLQKPDSSNPEELEIEIAEVLYGLMTSSKKEDSKEGSNRWIGDSKPNTTSAHIPLSAVAPKRKRPRQVLDNPSFVSARSSPISAKPETDPTPISSPILDRVSGSNAHEMASNSVSLPPEQSPAEPESAKLDSEPKPVELLKERRDLVVAKEEVVSLPKGEELSPASRPQESNRVDSSSIATDSAATEIQENNPVESETETLRQEKLQIDLMAPPPQVRSSPGRDAGVDSRVVDEKPVLPVLDMEMKPIKSASLKDSENENGKRWIEEPVNVAAPEVKRGKVVGKDAETDKENENKVKSVDLKLDLANGVKDGFAGVESGAGNKAGKPLASKEEPVTEKSGHTTNSLPLPMSMPSWPGGIPPPMGYMPPLQGVVPMDGTAVTPAPIQQSFGQPRPKRCATHCYIARNIHSLQQLMKMNPFWPAAAAAAGSSALFGSKPCVMPTAADLQSMTVRGVNNPQEKMHNPANVPNHAGVKDKSSHSANTTDSTHRKQQQQQQPQILIQPSLPSMPPNNMMTPTFIFPLNQHLAAASARPSAGKASSGGSTAASSNIPGPAGANASAAPGGASAAMGFNFPNNMQMQPMNETQYLAILQNNAYSFPMGPVGAPSNYRATPAQAMPLFSGSFYPSQMIHPSQIQAQHTPATQSHQNASVSGSSSSQKHLQNHQQRPQSSGGPGNINLQNFPPQKSQASQQLQQPSQNQRPRNLEGEQGNEDSPSMADNRGLPASMNIFSPNFAMPMHPQNFALMTPPAGLANAAPTVSSNQSEKKSQQSQHGVKNGMDSLPPHSFAMSFGSMNGALPPGIDITSMAQNHAFFQSFPEAARQNIQMMAAAQSAQQKKNFRTSEDNKSAGNDSPANDDERKNLSAKSQSIAFSRSDLSDAAIQSSSVIESSTRSVNPSSGLARSSQAMTSNIQSAHLQSQLQSQLQQQQYMMMKQQQQHQHQQQQQQQVAGAAANSRNKASNGSIYSEHINSSSTMTAKFPNALSGFPQNLVQSNSNSPSQSPQWKGSRTTPTSQAPSSLAASMTSSLKNLPQQQQQQQHSSQIRPQMHTQISFGGTQKRSTNSPGQQTTPSNHQAPSPPMVVGSPTHSSMSKGASGSPRTTTPVSTSNRMGQASALSAQQPQHSQGQKSLSILGNPHTASSLGGGGKPQSQQHLPKNLQQGQLFFTYPQSQSPHSTSSNSGPGGYFMPQRRRPDQQQQQPPGGPGTSSNGMLSMCSPVTLGSTATNDPAKAIAAATCNQKGGGLSSQGIMHTAQFSAQGAGAMLPAGYQYIHPVPTAVQVKPAEQKQPAA